MRFAIIFLFLSCTAPKTPLLKSIPQQSLKEFTYLVFHNSKKGKLYAAGFFFETEAELYFITASHVADTPVDFLDILIDRDRNITYRFNNTDGHRKGIEENFGNYDIYIKRVNRNLLSQVKSINKFIPDYSKFDFSKVESVVYFGFPELKSDTTYNFRTTFPHSKLAEDTIIGSYNYFRYSKTFNKFDSINYMSGSINGTFSSPGFSGSPVFFKIHNEGFAFGGMCTAGVKSYNVAYIMRPEKLLDSLKSFRIAEIK